MQNFSQQHKKVFDILQSVNAQNLSSTVEKMLEADYNTFYIKRKW